MLLKTGISSYLYKLKYLNKLLPIHMQLAGAYDVIVNCTGMQSRELCNDLEVVPVKGQVIKVKAPWIKHFTALNDVGSWPIYIIPRYIYCILVRTSTYIQERVQYEYVFLVVYM